jgi:hypothetical protein
MTAHQAAPEPVQSAALAAFCSRWDAAAPNEAMALACDDARRRAGGEGAPVSLTKVANALGATIESRKLESVGRLSVAGDRWKIAVAEGQWWRRARFTIAHEVAHVLLYESVAEDPVLVRELNHQEQWSEIEALCNYGAGELLIPAADLQRNIPSPMELSHRSLQKLYDRYLVSYASLTTRLAEVFPGFGVLRWKYTDHPKGAAWRIAGVNIADSSVWVPRGMSSSRLGVDLVGDALRFGTSEVLTTTLRLSDYAEYRAPMRAISTSRRPREEQPTFAGIHVVDDPGRPTVVLIIAVDRAEVIRHTRMERKIPSHGTSGAETGHEPPAQADSFVTEEQLTVW